MDCLPGSCANQFCVGLPNPACYQPVLQEVSNSNLDREIREMTPWVTEFRRHNQEEHPTEYQCSLDFRSSVTRLANVPSPMRRPDSQPTGALVALTSSTTKLILS